MKPGYKTTEFWLTVVAMAISLLVAYGAITADEGDAITGALAALLAAIGAVLAAVLPVVSYTKSRTEVKTKGN